MKYDGYYLVEVLIPETYSLTVKAGWTNYHLCTRNGNNFYDVGTNNSYLTFNFSYMANCFIYIT